MLYLGMKNKLIEGIQFFHYGSEILNIQYVNDTFFFLTPFDSCIINLKRILCCFQACSKLKINFSKSSLTGVGISDLLVDRYSVMLGCSKSPYLSPTVVFPYILKEILPWLGPVIDKITGKLESWKSKYYSIGGRLTLLNLVLSVIPTYYLSILHLPAKVEKEIDKIRRRFLWSTNSATSKGMFLAKWQCICRKKHQDGLEIINIRNFSVALKCKLLSQLMSNSKGLKWPTLIKSRYFYLNNYGALLNISSTNSSLIWKEPKSYYPMVNAFTSFWANNGKKILFWENKWSVNTSLKFIFFDLYSLAKNKKISLDKIVLTFLNRGQEAFNNRMFDSTQYLNSHFQQQYGFLNSISLSDEEDSIFWTKRGKVIITFLMMEA